jgi:transposase
MYVIGIDPHRGSHAAAVLDRDEQVRAVLHLPADRQQRQRLLSWATGFMARLWAVEGATGTGALLAQQLVAAGEQVVDVPPKLAARVRVLDNNHSDKTDSHDARSTAIVALRSARLRRVGLEDDTAVLRLLAKRHHDLIAGRTRAMCRLHTTVCFLIEGHLPRRLRADRAARILAGIRPTTAIEIERKALARDLSAKSAVTIGSLLNISSASDKQLRRRAPRSPSCTASDRSSLRTSSATAATSSASRAPGTTPATTRPPRSKPPAAR